MTIQAPSVHQSLGHLVLVVQIGLLALVHDGVESVQLRVELGPKRRPFGTQQCRLSELVRAFPGRPRHKALRGHVTELLRSGFGAPYEEIGHEVYLLDGSGPIDTMWGATIIDLSAFASFALFAVPLPVA
jgi:hypothetical protein